MPGLVDITPAIETVDVRGHPITVRDLSFEALGSLVLRFPRFRQMVETGKWDGPALLKMSDEAIAAVIAACCAELDERTAGFLALGEKAVLLGVIYRLTTPKGLGPFLDLMLMFGLLDGAASGTALGTTSPSPSNFSNGMGTRKPKNTAPVSSPAG